jgi:hypothetical protein
VLSVAIIRDQKWSIHVMQLHVDLAKFMRRNEALPKCRPAALVRPGAGKARMPEWRERNVAETVGEVSIAVVTARHAEEWLRDIKSVSAMLGGQSLRPRLVIVAVDNYEGLANHLVDRCSSGCRRTPAPG